MPPGWAGTRATTLMENAGAAYYFFLPNDFIWFAAGDKVRLVRIEGGEHLYILTPHPFPCRPNLSPDRRADST